MLEKMLQLCCNLEDVMGKRLSNEEIVLIYELHKKGFPTWESRTKSV